MWMKDLGVRGLRKLGKAVRASRVVQILDLLLPHPKLQERRLQVLAVAWLFTFGMPWFGLWRCDCFGTRLGQRFRYTWRLRFRRRGRPRRYWDFFFFFLFHVYGGTGYDFLEFIVGFAIGVFEAKIAL